MMGYGTTNRSARVRQTVLMGLMFALAMVLSYVESMITVPGLPPGVKLGLSNIVTMYCVFFLGWRQAYTLAVLKGSFALLTRGFTAACMSTAGGLVSVTVYYLPIMAVSGVGMGVATGVLLRVMLPYMNKLQLVKH